MKQLLERFAFARHHLPHQGLAQCHDTGGEGRDGYKAYNMHEQSRKRITVEHYDEDFLHRLDLCVLVSFLQCIPKRL